MAIYLSELDLNAITLGEPVLKFRTSKDTYTKDPSRYGKEIQIQSHHYPILYNGKPRLNVVLNECQSFGIRMGQDRKTMYFNLTDFDDETLSALLALQHRLSELLNQADVEAGVKILKENKLDGKEIVNVRLICSNGKILSRFYKLGNEEQELQPERIRNQQGRVVPQIQFDHIIVGKTLDTDKHFCSTYPSLYDADFNPQETKLNRMR